MREFSKFTPPKYMRWQDIQEVFGFGKNKSLALLHAAGPEYIGRIPVIREEKFYAYLENQNKPKHSHNSKAATKISQ